MTKAELEGLLRRAGRIANERDFFLIGSQALRGVCPVWPRDFPKTIEADLYPRHHPQTWSLLREALGSQSVIKGGDIVPQLLAQLGLGLHHPERLADRGHDRRRERGGEHVGARRHAQDVEVRIVGDAVAADRA